MDKYSGCKILTKTYISLYVHISRFIFSSLQIMYSTNTQTLIDEVQKLEKQGILEKDEGNKLIAFFYKTKMKKDMHNTIKEYFHDNNNSSNGYTTFGIKFTSYNY